MQPHPGAQTGIAPLPPAAVDSRLARALHAQLAERQALILHGVRRIGWKLAYGIPAVEAVQGDRPAVGYLTSASELGLQHDPAGALELRADVGLAVELGHAVWPDDDDATLLASIGAVAVGLELVDLGADQHDLHEVVRRNVLHQGFALGPARPPSAEPAWTASLEMDGDIRAWSRSPVDAAAALRDAARLLTAVGERLLPGDWLLTGSLVQVPVKHGDRMVAATIEGLGAVPLKLREAAQQGHGP